MPALYDIPPPRPGTTIALLGLVVVAWVFLKVQILRRQLGRDDTESVRATRIGFLHRLAAWRWTYGVLAALAVGFAVLLWWSLAQ